MLYAIRHMQYHMQFKFFSHNGKILPLDQATVPLSNIEYSYGFGVYETLKVRNNTVYFVDQHLKRLEQSARIINLEHTFPLEKITHYIFDLLNKHGEVEACNIKLLLIGADKKEEAQLYILLLAPLFPDRKLYTHGAKTISMHYQRIFPNAKTLHMLGSYLAYKRAKQEDCYDALLVDEQENILEGTRTNLFAIQGNKLLTPPKEKVLEGVTRQTVIYVAKQKGFTVEEQHIPLQQISSYDGLFLTSTSTKIIPIQQIDRTKLQIPDSVKQLMRAYDAFLEESKGVFREVDR